MSVTLKIKSRFKLPSNKKYQTGRRKARLAKIERRVKALATAQPKFDRKMSLNAKVGKHAAPVSPLYDAGTFANQERPDQRWDYLLEGNKTNGLDVEFKHPMQLNPNQLRAVSVLLGINTVTNGQTLMMRLNERVSTLVITPTGELFEFKDGGLLTAEQSKELSLALYGHFKLHNSGPYGTFLKGPGSFGDVIKSIVEGATDVK